MKYRHSFWQIVFIFLIISGCNSGKKTEEPTDKFNKGIIHISCDESFKPVIDAQVEVYEGLFPDAKIIVHYKPEAECLHDFAVDSISMIIATRGPSEREKKFMIDSMHVGPVYATIARDLIAVIVNTAAKDTFFSIKEIKDLLTGKLKENLIPVFDGARATSTVRFMLDSILKNEPLGKKAAAAKSSADVIDYVSKTPNAVGFVGFSWIGNQEDTAQVSYLNKIKLAYVESTDSVNGYVQPSQYFIYTKTYPMVRDLVYTLKEKHQGGLARAFALFLESMQGQLIFRRAYLMPVILPNYVRDAELQNTINK